MQDNIFTDGLNEPQKAAVLCPDGPMLIIAGAGSGKTRVLTMRIAKLMADGVRPYNILALTFTNKAAREMKERIAGIVGAEAAHQLWMGTFHSIFAKILRIEATALGLSSDFTIYDSQDSQSLIKKIVKEMNLNDKNYKPSAVLSSISKAKNDLILPQAYAQNANLLNQDKAAQRPHTSQIYNRYAEECRKANALDFDDLLLYTNILFQQNPTILLKYQNKFQHILVDEYQDTNISQYSIINRLAKAHQNICVVGDDAQSIYSFRGARIQNILSFRNDYPGCQVFKLEQNYRSTQNIVGAANKLITYNANQLPKNVFSKGDEGDKVLVRQTDSDFEEADSVVRDIAMRMRYENKRASDFAILYRTNSQSRIFEDRLRKNGVPYKVYGGLAFYQRKEIKDVLAYLRLTVNHNDIESLRRVINYPKRQIGDTSVDRIEAYATQTGLRMWDVVSDVRHLAQTGINGPTQKRIGNFVSLIEMLTQESFNADAYQLAVDTLSQSGILADLSAQRTDNEGKERYENVQELLNGLKDYVDTQKEEGEDTNIRTYLQEVALISDLDSTEEADHVTMMTIHTSKGLEFDTVYIVGVEEEIFPGQQSALSPDSLEEERRLMYVALTRAERNVTVSYARQRYRYGKNEACRPSRFIAELDPKYCTKPVEELRNDGFGNFSRGNGNNSGFGQRNGGFNNPYGAGRQRGGQYGGSSAGRPTRPVAASGLGSGMGAGMGSGTSTSQFTRLQRPGTDFQCSEEPTLATTADGRYSVGDRIVHERFGRGTIAEITGANANDTKLKIEFDNQGTKTLLLKFARIDKI